jgi:hypothetical protein
MAKNTQGIIGFNNNQTIINTNIIVDDKYIASLLVFQNNPSVVNQVILLLYNSLAERDVVDNKLNLPPLIEQKIDFNNVLTYKELIKVIYSENGFFIDSAYDALDTETPGRKKVFLKFINSLYLIELGELGAEQPTLTKIELIRKNADRIITNVVNRLLLRAATNPKDIQHIPHESIEFNIIAIVIHAFVDCKVLENPNSFL